MALAVLNSLLAFAPAPAPGTTPDPRAGTLQLLGMLIFTGLAMYLVMYRPQQKKMRQHAELLKTLRGGDKIVTTGGVLGVVITVKEKSVTIRSADTKMEVLKSAVAEVLEKSSSTATES